MSPMSIWQQWDLWASLVRTRDYFETSQIFAYFERPLIVTLWALWPWLHIALVIVVVSFISRVSAAVPLYEKHYGSTQPDPTSPLIVTFVFTIIFLGVATLAGYQYQSFNELRRANPTIIPKTLPPRPPLNPRISGFGIKDPAYAPYRVSGPRVVTTFDMANTGSMLRTSLDFVIVLSLFALWFVVLVLDNLKLYFFSFAYDRESARTHLPTEIVDRALSGGRLDHQALADAMTPSTTPVRPDSLREQLEREKLTELAKRLDADQRALNEKLLKESEVAHLVVSHARKRAELEDMEKKLRDMGVKRNG